MPRRHLPGLAPHLHVSESLGSYSAVERVPELLHFFLAIEKIFPEAAALEELEGELGELRLSGFFVGHIGSPRGCFCRAHRHCAG